MKVLFFGTSEFALEPLEKLVNSTLFEVVGVICTPDAKGKRGKQLLQPPVKKEASKYSIEVFQPEKLKTQSSINKIKSFNADVFVVASYGKFIPDVILNIPQLKAINIHPSLLPKYRGPSPINFALLNGDSYTGVSIIEVSSKIDAGDIYMQWIEKITEKDNYKTLHDRLSKIGAKMLLCTLENLTEINPKPQDEKLATYTKVIRKEDGLINFTEETAKEIVNKIRAFHQWPGAYFNYKGKMFKILSATLVKTENPKPSTIVELSKDQLIIGCKENAIAIKNIQPQSKKPMSIKAFLAGHKFNVGETIQ